MIRHTQPLADIHSRHAFRLLGPIVLALCFGVLSVSPALAHNSPIDLFAGLDDKLFIGPSFDAGPLNLLGGVLLTTDTPGIGALSIGNNVANGTEINLTITRGLLYWNGVDVVPTDATMLIDAPTEDGFSNPNNSPIPSYNVTGTSPAQSGMLWGTYVASPGWDAHGRYTITPSASPTGLYGLAVQIDSPSYDPTDTFLIPLEYDPQGDFSPANIAAGTDFMNDIIALPGDANRDGTINGLDANILSAGWLGGPLGYSLGNVVIDADVNGLDANLISANWLATAPSHSVPEPSSAMLGLMAFAPLARLSRRHRDGPT